MKIYCEKRYKSFKDLMQSTLDTVYSDESKKGFDAGDVLVLQLFSLALNMFCADLEKLIKKDFEEDEK